MDQTSIKGENISKKYGPQNGPTLVLSDQHETLIVSRQKQGKQILEDTFSYINLLRKISFYY